ncbi:MAG: HAMP domain-containing protein [Alphaproteobacteria bacterium]|nr:MAG: HAMP domain-containing protein [Alphaproteobacteria bacterium]
MGRQSVPFSVTILTLMALIVVPLSSSLLWLGWRAVDRLEKEDVGQRMAELDTAVAGFLGDNLRLVVSLGQALGEQPEFAPQAGVAADGQRLRQLAGLLRRHPGVDAAFVGYPDGRMLYAGRTESSSPAQRVEFHIPPGDPIVQRVIAGEGAARQEVWRFLGADGSLGEPHARASDFDPRQRPWYSGALRSGAPALTAPYRFAWSQELGLSVGVPMPQGGVIGFDASLGTLSRLIVQYKVTPNAVIVIASGTSDVFIETRPCDPTDASCLPGDEAVRALVKRTVVESAGRPLQRDVEVSGRAYKLIVNPLAPLYGRGFAVAAAVPVEELTVISRALLARGAWAGGAAVGLAILAAFAVSLLLSRSMARLAAKTQHFRDLDFSDRVPVRSRITEVLRLSEAVERMREGLEVFGHYVSKDLVRQIMRSPASTGVGGERRDVSVMFTDIEGFSRISEAIAPEVLTSRLSHYFEALGVAISANRGMIDKYIGDSVMAFWNAPEPDPDHVLHACRAALQAAEASRALAKKWHGRGRPVFRTRFGLHAGPAIVGNVGARERMNYTLVGAVANQASRLEGLNKVYGTEILASGEVAARTAEQFVWRPIDRIVAAGTTEAMEICEPLGEAPQAADHAVFLEHWLAGRAAYIDGRFAEAIGHFETAAALRPGDGPCRVLIARCLDFARSGVPAEWDGAWHFDFK